MKRFIDDMGLGDASCGDAPEPSHHHAPESSGASRIDAVYANPKWRQGVAAGHMVREEEMRNKKGHRPLMVTVDLSKEGEAEGDMVEEDIAVHLPPSMWWPTEGEHDRWQ